MLTAAQAVADVAREVAARTEAERALAPELLDALHAKRIFGLGVPRSLGGSERPPADTLAVAETIARGDASAGWCVAIAATSGLLAAYLAGRSVGCRGAESGGARAGSVHSGRCYHGNRVHEL